ncbi:MULTISPECIES: autotransporter-associated beta strand repeat-containing protein, partial [unclassified Pseudomonas]|uniref:autotransporter-associated beta strand repeat-containing protein n=1 Tax=unclassified Pseudomonas TaxID=196821 RepID=UPI0021C6DED4
GGANPGIFPADVVLGQITLSMDNVAKTANIVVNSPALAIQYWDGTSLAGNGAVEGGSGVWNATNTNWTKSSGAINDVWRGVSAIFQNGSGTVVIQDTQTISALQFKSDGYVLYADVADGLNLVNGTGGSALVTVDSGITGTLDTPLSGTGKLQKSGAGTLVLTRSNRYSGGTTLSAGTLLVRDDAALGSAALSLASGTTLQTDRFEQRLANNLVFSGVSNINVDAGSLTLSGGVSGAGGLIKIGTGSLTLSGNNTQLGNTWLNAGGLVLGSNTALGAGALITAHNTTLDSSLSGALIGNDVAISGDLTFLGTRDLSLDGTLSGLGNLIKNGASTLSLMKASSLNGSVTLNQGTLRLGDNNALGASLNNLNVTGVSTLQALSSLSIANFIDLDAQLTISGPNDLAISGWIGGNGGLIKDGSGTLTLSGVNSYQGGTELKSGTLKLSSTLGGGVLDVTGVASLEATQALLLSNPMNVGGSLTLLGNYETSFFHGLISGAGTITKTGTADLRIDANSRFSGTYNIDGGRIYAGVNSLGNPTLVNIASGAMLELGFSGEIGELNGAGGVLLHGGNLTVASGNFSGELSGNGSLSKTGSGILLLSGASSLRATTFVDAGTLRVDGSLGGTVIVSSDAVLTGRGSLAGNVTIANGGHLSLAGGSVLTLGSLVLNDTSNLDVALGAVTPGAAGLANVTGNLTLDGRLNIANTGGFGIGVYRLFDYGGALTNNGLDFGTLPSGVPLNELALQTNVANQINLVVGGAADIRFWDGSQLTGNSVVDGGDGTWNSTNSNWTTTNAGFNEAWNSTFAVFQGAAGTVTVDGTQSVTGLQFINNYTLAGGSAGQLQLVSGISGDTAVRVDSGKTAILDVNLTGNGILNKLDSGTLVLNGSNSHTDGTRLSGGTLVLGNNDALGSGSLTTSAGTTLDTNTALSLINDLHLTGALTLGGSHDLVLNGLVLGNGTLVKNGSGTLTLNQANDYAGTALNAGTLLLGNSAALGAGQLTVAGPASLDTSAAMTLGNAIDFGVNTGSRLTLAGNHDLTLSGVL